MRSLRLAGFRVLLDRVMPLTRQKRMAEFVERCRIRSGQRILDVGGSSYIWQFVDMPLDLTILNLPGETIDRMPYGQHRYRFVEGDATSMSEFADDSFDLAFSNSCIEHVGGEANQRSFAREVRRVAKTYYVQTPAKAFPLEPHSGLPFWWFYPRTVKNAFFRHWAATVPDWGNMVRGTTVLSRKDLRSYFPDGTIVVERIGGLPKSYIVYKTEGIRP